MLLCIFVNWSPPPLGSIMYVITMLCWTVSTAGGVFEIQNSGHSMLPLNGHVQRQIPLTQRTVSNVIRVCSHANLHDPHCHRNHVERVGWMQNAVCSWLEPHHPRSGTERERERFELFTAKFSSPVQGQHTASCPEHWYESAVVHICIAMPPHPP
jgi:hypothetical protein